MSANYYKLPLRLGRVIHNEEEQLDRCTLIESIDQHLELLITTCPGEHSFDRMYGTQIWDLDFERVLSKSKWEEQFASYILEAVEKYEKRLMDIRVQVKVKEIVHDDRMLDSVTIRKRADIYVWGVIEESNQKCAFNYSLYLGPLSNE